MKYSKILLFNTAVIIVIISVILMIRFDIIKMHFFAEHMRISDARAEISKRLALSNDISMLLNKLDLALYDENKKISENELNKILERLNQKLDEASQTFGLIVRRSVLLFKIWQINNIQKVFEQKKLGTNSDLDFQAFSLQISHVIEKANSDFKLSLLEQLVYPRVNDSESASKVFKKIDNIYTQKFIPIANRDNLHSGYGYTQSE